MVMVLLCRMKQGNGNDVLQYAEILSGERKKYIQSFFTVDIFE